MDAQTIYNFLSDAENIHMILFVTGMLCSIPLSYSPFETVINSLFGGFIFSLLGGIIFRNFVPDGLQALTFMILFIACLCNLIRIYRTPNN